MTRYLVVLQIYLHGSKTSKHLIPPAHNSPDFREEKSPKRKAVQGSLRYELHRATQLKLESYLV